MLEALLPAAAIVVETREDWADVELFPVEEAAIAAAVESRRREFSTGRGCARLALERLGLPPTAIPVGGRGEPGWPAGVVGSITHCRGFRGCAVARSDELAAVGIDAEPHEALKPGIVERIATAAELTRIGALAAIHPAVHWDRLLFSAKEAFFKVWFPLADSWLDFEDAAVEFDPDGRSFRIELLGTVERRPGGHDLSVVEGRWLADAGLALAAISLPPT